MSIDVSYSVYDKLVAIQKYNGTPIQENIIGNKRVLLADSVKIASLGPSNELNIGLLPKSKFGPFMAVFTKNLYKSFQTNPELLSLDIPGPSGLTVAHNHDIWDELRVGDYFYNLDFKSAYWQFAHKLGYIDTKLFEKYMQDDVYKEVKRYCISFLGRENYTHYYDSTGVLINTIYCDTSPMQKVYENIRNAMYTLIAEAVKSTPSWLYYNQDSITVKINDVLKVMTIFTEAGIKFKKHLCQKLTEDTYQHGIKVKKFI